MLRRKWNSIALPWREIRTVVQPPCEPGHSTPQSPCAYWPWLSRVPVRLRSPSRPPQYSAAHGKKLAFRLPKSKASPVSRRHSLFMRRSPFPRHSGESRNPGYFRNSGDGPWRHVRHLGDILHSCTAVRSPVVPAKAGIQGIFVTRVTGLGGVSVVWVTSTSLWISAFAGMTGLGGMSVIG